MKKLTLLLIFLIVFGLFSGCEKEKTPVFEGVEDSGFSDTQGGSSVPDEHIITGEILSVEQDKILVSTDQQNSAISPQVYVNISGFSDKEFAVGDKIEVVFNGQVAQSFPPQILGVIDIKQR